MEEGLNVIWGPGDESAEVKDTAPENPLRLVNVTTTLLDDPGATVRVEELRASLKSGVAMVTVTMTECVPDEPVPVIVTE